MRLLLGVLVLALVAVAAAQQQQADSNGNTHYCRVKHTRILSVLPVCYVCRFVRMHVCFVIVDSLMSSAVFSVACAVAVSCARVAVVHVMLYAVAVVVSYSE